MSGILHVTEDHSVHNTGVTTLVKAILCQLPQLEQAVVCTGTEPVPTPPGVDVTVLTPHRLTKFWRYPMGQAKQLQESIEKADILHLHGIWMWIQWASTRLARQKGIPDVLSVHGMLEKWMWSYQSLPNRLKKTGYWKQMGYPVFKNVSVLHAITPLEASRLRAFFPGQRVEVIPHGLDLQGVDQQLQDAHGRPGHRPYFLFLGRLHPVKAVDLLIRAFARLPQKDFILKIAGPVQERDKHYAHELHQLVKQLGLDERVEFIGEVQGREKWELYQNAWAFCLPSHTEAIGMVNLEAAACRTPVLTTAGCGLVEEWGLEGGVITSCEAGALAGALASAADWSENERKERGVSLRRLVEQRYSWKATAPLWEDLYRSLRECI